MVQFDIRLDFTCHSCGINGDQQYGSSGRVLHRLLSISLISGSKPSLFMKCFEGMFSKIAILGLLNGIGKVAVFQNKPFSTRSKLMPSSRLDSYV